MLFFCDYYTCLLLFSPPESNEEAQLYDRLIFLCTNVLSIRFSTHKRETFPSLWQEKKRDDKKENFPSFSNRMWSFFFLFSKRTHMTGEICFSFVQTVMQSTSCLLCRSEKKYRNRNVFLGIRKFPRKLLGYCVIIFSATL